MSYSWACVGEFEIPAERLGALQDAEKPWITELDDVREDAALTDTIYDGTTMRYRSVFEKSSYADKVDVIEELLEIIIAHGGHGALHLVGFDDGGPDEGETFLVKDGATTRADIATPAEVEAVRARPDYLAMRERFFEAFGGE